MRFVWSRGTSDAQIFPHPQPLSAAGPRDSARPSDDTDGAELAREGEVGVLRAGYAGGRKLRGDSPSDTAGDARRLRPAAYLSLSLARSTRKLECAEIDRLECRCVEGNVVRLDTN